MPTREEIFEKVSETLVDSLNVDPEDIKPESTLQGDLGAAHLLLEEALATARRAGVVPQLASLSCNLAALAIAEGDRAAARSRLEEGLAYARELGNAVMVATSLNSLGEVARLEGDLEAARGFFERAAALCRGAATGHSHAEARFSACVRRAWRSFNS